MRKYEILFVNNRGEEKYYRNITCNREEKEEKEYLDAKIDKYLKSHPGYEYRNLRKITCRACIDEILNQEGHMEYGNCLYDPDLE